MRKTGNTRTRFVRTRCCRCSKAGAGKRRQSEVARSLEISVKTLANWVGEARSGKAMTKGSRAPIGEAQAELSRLRQENATLRMERDILKKAAAYFAKESM